VAPETLIVENPSQVAVVEAADPAAAADAAAPDPVPEETAPIVAVPEEAAAPLAAPLSAAGEFLLSSNISGTAVRRAVECCWMNVG
jgi:hypothetical protein